jgi:hypothetical protein
MKELLIRRLFIPLLLASGLSFGIAYLLNKSLDYSSIFLNLSTDFIMVLITIWYVDRILKRHEEEKWKDIELLIKLKLYELAGSAIESICAPMGIHDQSLQERKEFEFKRNSQLLGGMDIDYYGDFAKKYVAGTFNPPFAPDSQEEAFAKQRRKTIRMSADGCKPILEQLKRLREEATQIIDLYGARLTAEQLKSIMNFQMTIQNPIISYDRYLARGEWWQWYQGLDWVLLPSLELLESSSLYWKTEGKG